MWSITLKWLYSVPFSELLYVLGLLEFTYAQLGVSLDFTSNEVLGLAKITYCNKHPTWLKPGLSVGCRVWVV